jgi:intraflagellar transport protein 122
VLSMSWTNDGQYLALGQFDGRVFICDKSGKETVTIQRPAPVWTLCWNPSRDEPQDILSVGCWDGTLSFYQLSGIQVSARSPRVGICSKRVGGF